MVGLLTVYAAWWAVSAIRAGTDLAAANRQRERAYEEESAAIQTEYAEQGLADEAFGVKLRNYVTGDEWFAARNKILESWLARDAARRDLWGSAPLAGEIVKAIWDAHQAEWRDDLQQKIRDNRRTIELLDELGPELRRELRRQIRDERRAAQQKLRQR